MTHFAPVRIRVEKDLITAVKRHLKGKGDIKVSAGQQVSPEDIIGTATISAGFRILNLANLLSVPASDVKKYLIKKIGDRIYKDELLAFKGKGWVFGGKKIVTAPNDGIVDFLNEQNGQLRMTFLPKKEDLPSGVYGIVEEVRKEEGWVLIRTQVSRIHGVFGSGRSRDGILKILNQNDLVSKSAILPKYTDHILACGNLFFKEALSEAISVGVSGIIVGGINAQDYRDISGRLVFPKRLDNDIGISVLVCEGFGSISIADDIFELLSKYDDKFVIIDGNKAQILLPSFSSGSLTKIKNTKLPPTTSEILDDVHTEQLLLLKAGLKVRITGNSYIGEQGTILALDQSPTLLSSGVKSYLATIETKRRKIQIPVANLEVIL